MDDNLKDITLLLAVDKEHVGELDFALKTWRKYKPEIYRMSKMLIYDSSVPNIKSSIESLDLINYRLHEFTSAYRYSSQREAMLTSFFEGINLIDTPFFMKIDTDCYANSINNKWIGAISDRNSNVFISNPWGYTKGPQMIYALEDWADKSEYFSGTGRLNLRHKGDSRKIIHSRIISYIYIGDTRWHKEISSICLEDNVYRLPCPSQDTFCWYCAKRKNLPYKTVKFKNFGFSHGRLNKHKQEIQL